MPSNRFYPNECDRQDTGSMPCAGGSCSAPGGTPTFLSLAPMYALRRRARQTGRLPHGRLRKPIEPCYRLTPDSRWEDSLPWRASQLCSEFNHDQKVLGQFYRKSQFRTLTRCGALRTKKACECDDIDVDVDVCVALDTLKPFKNCDAAPLCKPDICESYSLRQCKLVPPCKCDPCACEPCACECEPCKCDPCACGPSCEPCECESCKCDPCECEPSCEPCKCESCKCEPCECEPCEPCKCDPCKCEPCECEPSCEPPCKCDPCECEPPCKCENDREKAGFSERRRKQDCEFSETNKEKNDRVWHDTRCNCGNCPTRCPPPDNPRQIINARNRRWRRQRRAFTPSRARAGNPSGRYERISETMRGVQPYANQRFALDWRPPNRFQPQAASKKFVGSGNPEAFCNSTRCRFAGSNGPAEVRAAICQFGPQGRPGGKCGC